MDDSLDPSARAALEASLKEKVSHLLSEQVGLAEQREALLAKQRRNDRDLADCRSTARLFRIEIEIPMPEREREMMTSREREIAMSNRMRMELREADARQAAMVEREVRNRVAHQQTPPGARLVPPSALEAFASRPAPVATSQLAMVAAAPPTAKRPSLKDFLLQRLREAGTEGAKAAPLREMFERAYGETIHEKTVGMTLYRMSKGKLVTRDGHTWFIATAPQGAETVNPGGDTPGSENRLI